MITRIKIKRLRQSAILPTRATEGAAGWDCYACIDSPIWLAKHTAAHLVPLGFALELPDGWEAQLRPRSGLAKKGVQVALGTIDSDYRGEVCAIVFESNPGFGLRPRINPGDRICQLVFSRVPQVALEETDTMTDTDRGAGGFGSTGA